MSGKPKVPVFPRDDEGMRRVLAHHAQTAPMAELIEWSTQAHRGTKLAPDNRAGKVGAKTQHIRDLVDAHRKLAFKPAELREHADEKILRKMSPETFGARVSEARKFHGIAKP